jgi:hypothetical protein
MHLAVSIFLLYAGPESGLQCPLRDSKYGGEVFPNYLSSLFIIIHPINVCALLGSLWGKNDACLMRDKCRINAVSHKTACISWRKLVEGGGVWEALPE